MDRVIVFDSVHPLARNNRCFDEANEYAGCGYAILVRLAREAQRRGLQVMTSDVYQEMRVPSPNDVCLADMVSSYTDEILKSGVRPAICMSLESPLVAKRFFHKIARYSGRFHHSYQFSGTKERLVGTGTVFHPLVFPMETRVPMAPKAWEERDYLVVVNSNKRASFVGMGSLKEVARSAVSQTYSAMLKATDPWMRSREIYVDRIEAIRYFSTCRDFSLYGTGWDGSIWGFGPSYHRAALRVFKGTIPPDVRRKREVMNGFKFALCFENCAFPGYVTEKIFDCFLAGCIPIYFGAPNICDIVPNRAFIDYRRFDSYADLDAFLRGMTRREASVYMDASREFLASAAFDRLTVDHFVNDILGVMEKEFA